MQKYFESFIDSTGKPVAGAIVAVTTYPGGAVASIYQTNSTNIPIPNGQVVTNSLGYFEFYAPDGRYTLTITSPTTEPRIIPDVQIEDPADGLPEYAAPNGSSLIGFLQAGAGAVARTIQDKQRETVSVKDFGAAGDGVTSDVEAFQKAYDAASPGGVVVVSAGNFNSAAATGSKAVLWQCFGSLNGSGNAPLDLPGVVETMFNRRKLIRQVQSTSTDYAAVQVQRTASHIGGTPGFVNAGFRSDVVIGADVTNFEWAVIGSVDNSAASGENTGVYGQGFQRSTGATWGGTFEARDLRNLGDAQGALVGCEVDVFANGGDANNCRVGLDVVVGKGTSGGAKCTAYAGLRITPVNADVSQGKFKNGIVIQGECDTGISLSSTGVDALQISGANVVGVDLSLGTFSGSAVRLNRGQKIAFENTDALVQSLDATLNIMRFDNAGTERVGLDMRGASPGVRVNGVQVIGPRDTGWLAMTGTANEGAAYDTSTVTLPQLAGRVMALQAALTAHGLLGA